MTHRGVIALHLGINSVVRLVDGEAPKDAGVGSEAYRVPPTLPDTYHTSGDKVDRYITTTSSVPGIETQHRRPGLWKSTREICTRRPGHRENTVHRWLISGHKELDDWGTGVRCLPLGKSEGLQSTFQAREYAF